MQLRLRVLKPSNAEELEEMKKRFPSMWPMPHYDELPEDYVIPVQIKNATYAAILEWGELVQWPGPNEPAVYNWYPVAVEIEQ